MGDGGVGTGCKAWPPAGGGCSGGRGRLHAHSWRRPAAAATVILTWGSVSVWRVTSTAQSTAPPTWAASAAAGTAGGGGGERRAAAGVCRRPCAAASAAAGAAARHPCPPWGCWAAGGAWGSAPHEGARMLAINILYPQRACVPEAAALRVSSAARLRLAGLRAGPPEARETRPPALAHLHHRRCSRAAASAPARCQSSGGQPGVAPALLCRVRAWSSCGSEHKRAARRRTASGKPTAIPEVRRISESGSSLLSALPR